MRLKDFFELEGAPKPSEFAKSLGIPKRSLWNYILNISHPDPVRAAKISEATRLHPSLNPLVSVEELVK